MTPRQKKALEEKRERVLHMAWKILNHRKAANERKGTYAQDQQCAEDFWVRELDKELAR